MKSVREDPRLMRLLLPTDDIADSLVICPCPLYCLMLGDYDETAGRKLPITLIRYLFLSVRPRLHDRFFLVV